MQFFTTLIVLAVALVGTASARPSTSTVNSQCNTGALKCCNSVQSTDTEHVKSILGALGILDQIAEGDQAGLTCTPINTGSVGGNPSCEAAPVCCNGNSYGGVSLGCAPINTEL
ncbi:fungal hydrophobin [Trametes versicolor FP-101664 SS1]|uniref:fungal hydrophobin n=1 Tax=Trametes versicolor (strain FP-101664) TaxID=717944 RepID=UPI0004623D42|nr:fungal hydrophobin [Trametes versicolor FP-101664 SS1]EIW52876.1 fungal hydrophobin [Trametes versicolor FP-101664 SS1]